MTVGQKCMNHSFVPLSRQTLAIRIFPFSKAFPEGKIIRVCYNLLFQGNSRNVLRYLQHCGSLPSRSPTGPVRPVTQVGQAYPTGPVGPVFSVSPTGPTGPAGSVSPVNPATPASLLSPLRLTVSKYRYRCVCVYEIGVKKHCSTVMFVPLP